MMLDFSTPVQGQTTCFNGVPQALPFTTLHTPSIIVTCRYATYTNSVSQSGHRRSTYGYCTFSARANTFCISYDQDHSNISFLVTSSNRPQIPLVPPTNQSSPQTNTTPSRQMIASSDSDKDALLTQFEFTRHLQFLTQLRLPLLWTLRFWMFLVLDTKGESGVCEGDNMYIVGVRDAQESDCHMFYVWYSHMPFLSHDHALYDTLYVVAYV